MQYDCRPTTQVKITHNLSYYLPDQRAHSVWLDCRPACPAADLDAAYAEFLVPVAEWHKIALARAYAAYGRVILNRNTLHIIFIVTGDIQVALWRQDCLQGTVICGNAGRCNVKLM